MAEKDLATSIGLVQISTDTVIDDIAFDILFTMYKKNPKPEAEQIEEFTRRYVKENPYSKEDKKNYEAHEKYRQAEIKRLSAYTDKAMNDKIEAAFKSFSGGSEWYDVGDKIKSTMLLGPPGQGKTTSFKQAARKVATALGLEFKLNPGDTERITPSDFMFVSMEFSGETQTTTLGGIPAKTADADTGTEYMTRLVNKRLAMASIAGGALVLLDDFPNAAPSVQNVGLSLTDEKRFQGLNLDNVYIGATGNLGALDGTHTTRLSTALRGRCKVYYTEDDLNNWIARVERQYRDNLGDVGLVGLLKRENQLFFEMPKSNLSGGFASPRTWENFLQDARRAVAKAGGRGHESKAMNEITRLANSMLGLEVGQKVQSYMHSMMIGADPLARKLITTGEFDQKAFKEKFGDGYSSESTAFAYQFIFSLADYAVQAIVSEGDFTLNKVDERNVRPSKHVEEVLTRFVKGAAEVNESEFSLGLNHLKSKLANQVDEWVGNTEANRRSLDSAVKVMMVGVLDRARVLDASRQQVMIEELSDINKYASSSRKRR